MAFLDQLKKLNISENNLSLHLNEAKFGFDHIHKYCDRLDKGSNILEIGCGSGVLLGMLCSQYKHLVFEGIEPFESGLENFSNLSVLNEYITKMNIAIMRKNYENFKPAKKYDLIFCINVFEHLNDWRHFVVYTSNWLNPAGRIVVLCPNYGLPYESHFRLPIIFNKNITYKMFRTYIVNFEKKYNFMGLWNSLNFVKKKDVKQFINDNSNMYLVDHLEIIDYLLKRIFHDEDFKKRQKLIGYIAIIFQKLGIIKLLKIFPNYVPYMMIEFKKIS